MQMVSLPQKTYTSKTRRIFGDFYVNIRQSLPRGLWTTINNDNKYITSDETWKCLGPVVGALAGQSLEKTKPHEPPGKRSPKPIVRVRAERKYNQGRLVNKAGL